MRCKRTGVLLFVVVLMLCFMPVVLGETVKDQLEPTQVPGFETRSLSLGEGKTMNYHYRPGDGPALVLVPGTWGDIHRFVPLIELLPKDMPLLVVELCWQGGQQPPTLAMSIESLADDVLQVIEHVGLKRFFVGGHSIGGMITVEIAGREVPGMIGAIPMEGWTHHSVAKEAFAGDITGELTPEQKAQRQADRLRGRKHLSQEQLDAIASIWRKWNGYACLERTPLPVLHLWGDRGKARPDRKTMQIPDRPSIKVVWIKDAGHLLMLQAPDQLAAAVLNLMQRHR